MNILKNHNLISILAIINIITGIIQLYTEKYLFDEVWYSYLSIVSGLLVIFLNVQNNKPE